MLIVCWHIMANLWQFFNTTFLVWTRSRDLNMASGAATWCHLLIFPDNGLLSHYLLTNSNWNSPEAFVILFISCAKSILFCVSEVFDLFSANMLIKQEQNGRLSTHKFALIGHNDSGEVAIFERKCGQLISIKQCACLSTVQNTINTGCRLTRSVAIMHGINTTL